MMQGRRHLKKFLKSRGVRKSVHFGKGVGKLAIKVQKRTKIGEAAIQAAKFGYKHPGAISVVGTAAAAATGQPEIAIGSNLLASYIGTYKSGATTGQKLAQVGISTGMGALAYSTRESPTGTKKTRPARSHGPRGAKG